MAGTWHQSENPGLPEKITGKSVRVRDALPRFDADERRAARFRPHAEIFGTGKPHLELRAALRAVGHPPTSEVIEDQHVVVEQLIREREPPSQNRRWMPIWRQQTLRVDSPDW